jgi:hypothetical protein
MIFIASMQLLACTNDLKGGEKIDKKPIIILLTLIFTVIFAGAVSAADTWENETVDTTGSVGQYPSMDLDSSGTPHITYASDTEDSLKYATRNNDGTWNIETITQTGSAVHSSLAIDSAGNPHVSFYNSTSQDLIYANKSGSGPWNFFVLDSTGDVGLQSSLTLDNDGYPVISYSDSTNSALKLARWSGFAWTLETINTNVGSGISSSIDIDYWNNPNVCYFNAQAGRLQIATPGVPWNIQNVPVTYGPTVDYSDNSIVCTGIEDVHVSCYESVSGVLMYLRKPALSTWTSPEIVDNGYAGASNSLKLDSAGNPYISYFDDTSDYLKIAHKVNGIWVNETVDSTAGAGYQTSLGLNAAGSPSIAYYNVGSFDLKYAYLGSSSSSQSSTSSQSTSSESGNSNGSMTANAATVTTTNNTVGMQPTGAPIVPLALAVLSLVCGLTTTRKKQ